MLKRTILYGTGLLLLSALVMTSCNSTDKLEKQQQEEIQQFLDDNPDLHFTLKKSGLYYLEMVPGSGDFAATHDTAYLFYSIYYSSHAPWKVSRLLSSEFPLLMTTIEGLINL